MTKNEFLEKLRKALNDEKKEEVEKTISYYSEMIDDIVDSGTSEEEAVNKMGKIDEIVKAAKNSDESDMAKTNITKNNPMMIALIIIGFPLWLPIIISILSVLFTIFVVMWVLIAVLWVCDISFGIAAIGSIIMSIGNIAVSLNASLLYFGLSLVTTGLCILLLKPILSFSKSMFEYTKKGFMFIFEKISLLIKKMKEKLKTSKLFKEENK